MAIRWQAHSGCIRFWAGPARFPFKPVPFHRLQSLVHLTPPPLPHLASPPTVVPFFVAVLTRTIKRCSCNDKSFLLGEMSNLVKSNHRWRFLSVLLKKNFTHVWVTKKQKICNCEYNCSLLLGSGAVMPPNPGLRAPGLREREGRGSGADVSTIACFALSAQAL